MKNNEIIKALKCCAEHVRNCAECPLNVTSLDHCSTRLAQNALDLINRLQAENSNLTSDLTSLKKDLTSSQAEIERLKSECGNQSTLWKHNFESIFETAKETVREEAIKELAEKLKEAPIKCAYPLLGLSTKEEITEHFNDIMLQVRDAIDNIAKELISRKCENQDENLRKNVKVVGEQQ